MENILEELICEGKRLENTLYSYQAARVYTLYKSNSEEEYQNWISAIKRVIKTSFPSELIDVKKLTAEISPENHRKILGLLNSLKRFPTEPISDTKQESKSVIIQNHQIQNNHQSIVFNIFIEAIKDEITGKQLKELKEIMKDFDKEPKKAKTAVLEKLKGLGSDVLSNIVSNILTNPSIYGAL